VNPLSIYDVFPKDWRDVFTPGHPVGMGLDLATTEKKTSNPSALTLTQKLSQDFYARLIIRWKTADPEVTEAILRHALDLPHGLKPRRLSIDATNERLWATQLRKKFIGLVPVTLVISSESIIIQGESLSYKQYTGNLLVNAVEENRLILPPESWVSTDFRLVKRDRGTFVAEIDKGGNHADTFDSTKLSILSLVDGSGPAIADAANVGSFGPRSSGRKVKNPYARQFEKRRGRSLTA